MHRISKDIRFCYGHRLMHHGGRCRHLHGHNGRATIVLETEVLDAQGMVRDFGDIETTVGRWLDEQIDHVCLLHEDDPLVPLLREAGERFHAVPFHPTAENLARMIFEQARAAGLPVVEVALWETDTACARYAP